MRACFEEEQPRLLGLPAQAFPCEERIVVRAPKTPYIRFDLNDYSIPHTHVSRALEVLATIDTVRVVEGREVLAVHPRSFDRSAQIEDPAHIQALIDHKRAGRAHRAMDRLHHAAPSGAKFFALAAERGVHLAVLTRGLIELLDTHGAAALENALLAALREDAAHLGAVRHFIDQHRAQRGQRPPIPVALPNDPRVRALTVRPHCLTDYEQLAREDTDERATEPPDAD
ncbi:MAG: Mu transposase domain-containing protein [Steroidobacteraceae bacterium]